MVHWIHFVFPLFLSLGPSGSSSAQKSQKRPQDAPMSRAKALGDEVSSILNTIREGYDKRVRPNYGGEPVVVGLTMYVLSISSLSEVQMDFTMDFYFRQTWKDPRLKFSGPPGMTTLTIGTEFLKTLWVPDTFFVNEKKSYFHTATTQNEFVRISQEGDVTRSIRLTVTATCPMDLRYFPMDRQLCTLEIESFGYTMSDIRYKWAKGASSVGVSSDVSLPQFKVMGYRQQAMEISLSTGNYSRLACEIQFVRSMGYYLIQIYIPSSLIVVISWVSFWLNRAATPARVALGVTTVLTMTTLMASTNAALPKVSYVKSIDVYLGTCFVMVFSSLLEYATLGYLGKRIAIRKNRYESLKKKAEEKLKEMEEEARKNQPMGCMGFQMHKRERGGSSKSQGGQTPEAKPAAGAGGGKGKEGDVENPVDLIIPPPKDLNKLYGMTPSDIDKYSRIIFPVCFICFKLTYWIIYLHISDVVEGDLVLLEKDD